MCIRDSIDGGSGIDTADYSDSSAGVIVSLLSNTGSGGNAEGDTLNSIENLIGSAYADTLFGDNGSNVLSGGDGNDILKGGGGADTLNGDGNNDVLKGGGGADTLNGGTGNDTASYSDSSSAVLVSLFDDVADWGDATGDDLNSIENVTGSGYNDQLWGNNASNVLSGLHGDDTLKGYGGADTLLGGDGQDTLYGMDGVDTLYGENGNDTLDGGNGKDSLFGGEDRDIFDFNSVRDSLVGTKRDIINDFERGLDDIDLRDIDAKSGGGNQAFTFIGTQQFHGVKGELHYKHAGGGLVVQGDINGDGHADFEILVKGSASLSGGDFNL